MVAHTFEWNFDTLAFLPPQQQISVAAGTIALALLIPAALTSFDRLVEKLGRYWRWIHWFTIPSLLLAAVHTV
jgi:DMSO/TMAO reductase YedYZ heme-binding membrane subunit